jgi:undecaprenyl-diphosphatase
VAVAKWVQALVPQDLIWAQIVSRAVDFPWILLSAGLIFALSWVLAGWRGAVLSIVSLAGMLALGTLLSPVIARPRPAAELVRVFRPFSGYSFPSFSALCYAATFGFLAVLAAMKSSGRLRFGLMIGCSVLLALCWLARIALGAHWPSDVLISYYLGLLWAACLIRFVTDLRNL